MSVEQYASIAIRKELLNTIGQLDLRKSLETLVTEAIVEYIRNKTFRVTNKTSNVWPVRFDFTRNTDDIPTNEYTPMKNI
jgi:hypothetical protein